MKQAVGSNHPGTGVAQDDELPVDNLLPQGTRVLAVVHADGYKTGVEGIELFGVPRELAQLSGAIGSPVPAVKDQEHSFAAHRGQPKVPARLVLQGEVWGQLAYCGSDLRPGQDLGSSQNGKQQRKDNPVSGCTQHGRVFYRSFDSLQIQNPPQPLTYLAWET
jgi:hypothetical protein